MGFSSANQRPLTVKDTYERISRLPTEFLSQELDNGLKAIGSRNLEEVLFHDGCISNSLEPYDDYNFDGFSKYARADAG